MNALSPDQASSTTLQERYNTPYWGEGYFTIENNGDLHIKPHPDKSASVPLKDVIARAKNEGLRLPLLVRFKDILHDRVNRLCEAFNQVSSELTYRGHYQVVYPIKVNQQRPVAEALACSEPALSKGQIGLEAGSKPELMAVLALSQSNDAFHRTIICNGYKDREYIRLALLGQKLGHRVFIVVEKSAELALILEEAKKLNVTPLIGLRARLASIGKGKWQNTGGEKSKFGLSANQILDAVSQLESAGALNCLQLLHFHLGSQIANIKDIQTGIHECVQFYKQLTQLKAPINTVDIGGGLGVDYEGTRSRTACSINYSLTDYAYTVLSSFQSACDAADLAHPDIISESGRALTAHHAVLVTNVIESERHPTSTDILEPSSEAPHAIQCLWKDYQSLKNPHRHRSIVEIYHDALLSMDEINDLFSRGEVSIHQRAQAETLYIASCRLVRGNLQLENRIHRDIMDELNEKLADKLFVNFSLFQSLPDIWGIDQIFPILPLENIHHAGDRRVVIQDITCDSDGRVDQYVTETGLETTLPLPEAIPGKPLELGFFMVGAYQEILGDMHNLFGDTDTVDVTINDKGDIQTSNALRGDAVEKVLKYVDYSAEWLAARYQQQLANTTLSAEQQSDMLRLLTGSLNSYTYLIEK